MFENLKKLSEILTELKSLENLKSLDEIFTDLKTLGDLKSLDDLLKKWLAPHQWLIGGIKKYTVNLYRHLIPTSQMVNFIQSEKPHQWLIDI